MYDEWGRMDHWVQTDRRLTQALISDVVVALDRHGCQAPTGLALVELTVGLHRALLALPQD